MIRTTTVLACLLVASGCNKDSGGGSATPAGSAEATAPATGSAGGFSADLAKELDMGVAGAGSAGAAGAGSAGAAGVGSAGAAEAAVATPGSAGSAGATEAAVATPGSAGSAGAKPATTDPKAGATAEPPAGDAKIAAVDPKAGAMPAGTAGKPPKPPTSVVIESGAGARPPVSVPAELRAINISLLPNWERDVEAAGTISFRVKLPNRTASALFVFRYGYEDPKAPADRDAYKKWLVDTKILTPKDDRQAGAAWYIEGTDASGKPAFRFVINYGGKKLVCYGSLYKDSASSALGDLRDQTILQAKQICETLAL